MKNIICLLFLSFVSLSSQGGVLDNSFIQSVNLKVKMYSVEKDIIEAFEGDAKDLILSLDYDVFVFNLSEFIVNNKFKKTYGLINSDIKEMISKELSPKTIKYYFSNKETKKEKVTYYITSKEPYITNKEDEKIIFQNSMIIKGKVIKNNVESDFEVIFNANKVLDIKINWDFVLDDEINLIVNKFNAATNNTYKK